MEELWDVYNKKREKIGVVAREDKFTMKKGEYHIVVTAVILNLKNEILITQRAPFKNFPLMWECNGGSILAGETSLQGIIREVKEEIGVEFLESDAVFLKTIERDEIPGDFKDIWLFRKEIKDEEITLPDGEAIDFKWVSIDEYEKMSKNKEIVACDEFTREDWEKAIKELV